MFTDWQTWVALAVVAAAAFYVFRRGLRVWRPRRQNSCQDCSGGGCGSSKQLPIVEIKGTSFAAKQRPQ